MKYENTKMQSPIINSVSFSFSHFSLFYEFSMTFKLSSLEDENGNSKIYNYAYGCGKKSLYNLMNRGKMKDFLSGKLFKMHNRAGSL